MRHTDPDVLSSVVLDTADGTQAALAAVLQATGTRTIDPDDDHVQAIIVPAGAELELPDLERRRDRPARIRGTVQLHDGDSFAAYIDRHTTDHTQWYVDTRTKRLVAVLNDHAAVADEGHAGWRDHRAVYQLRTTPEWDAWANLSGQKMAQAELAEHIEDNRADIVDPPAADLLELVQHFQATNNATFNKAIRLDSGEIQVTYNEDIQARGGRDGQLTIPEHFTLALAPFQGCELIEVTAQLRYRVAGGLLAIGYQLLRVERILADALNDIVAKVAEATGIAPLFGEAPEALR